MGATAGQAGLAAIAGLVAADRAARLGATGDPAGLVAIVGQVTGAQAVRPGVIVVQAAVIQAAAFLRAGDPAIQARAIEVRAVPAVMKF